MAGSQDDEMGWNPDPDCPQDPEFYRRVLHYMPTPLLVVDNLGQIMYGNQALYSLGGWTEMPASDVTVLDFIHPDDRDELAEAFVDIIASAGARVLGTGRPWAEIYLRILTADGTTLPIELIGSGGLLDDAVGGVIYEARPAGSRNLVGGVLDGLSQGASMHHLLTLVAQVIASPPLDLQAAVLQSTPGGGFLVAASTSPILTDALRSRNDQPMPWHAANRQPTYVAVDDLPVLVAALLKAGDFQDLWHVAVESPLTASTLRIIAVSPTHHVPAKGPTNRMVRARELAAAVLLRTQSAVLEYAADNDPLTDVANVAAFRQVAEAMDPTKARASIHIGLHGLDVIKTDLGAASADAALHIVADRLRTICETQATIGRVDDDEFSILLGNGDDEGSLTAQAMDLAAEFRTAILETIFVAGRPIMLSTNIGVAVAGGGISTDHLLTWSDAAMHDAKHGGSNLIRRYGIAFG